MSLQRRNQGEVQKQRLQPLHRPGKSGVRQPGQSDKR